MIFPLKCYCIHENIWYNASNSWQPSITKVISISKPDYKILFAHAFPEKNQPHFEQIYTYRHLRMLADLMPCFFHATRPMYIVKNKYGILITHKKTFIEIFKRSYIGMIAIEEGEPNILTLSEQAWQ